MVGFFLPQVLGAGYGFIENLLQGGAFSLLVLLSALLVLKLLCTALCLGSGFRGGMIAPALVLGSVLGAVFAQTFNQFASAWQVPPAAFALVGMAAVLAGALTPCLLRSCFCLK